MRYGDEARGRPQPLQPYHVILFINGRQCGDNQNFIDWHTEEETNVDEARAYFTGEGYQDGNH